MSATVWGFIESVSGRWAGWMAMMSWQVTVLALGVFLLTLVFRRMPAGLRYVLWLLVFVKLVLPPGLATPWSLGSVFETARLAYVDTGAPFDAAQEGETFASRANRSDRTDRSDGTGELLGASNGEPIGKPGTTAGIRAGRGELRSQRSPRLLGWGMLLWATGAAVLVAFVMGQYVRYSRRLLKGASPPPPAVTRLLARLSVGPNARSQARVMVSPGVRTPAVFGIRRPVVLLPEAWPGQFSEEELSVVLLHELAHIRRRDLLIGWLATLLTCLYWFHPVVWLVNLYLRREREMACDDMVLESTKQQGKEYASTLLRVAESFDGRVPVGVGLLGLMEVSEDLLRRIRSAADASRPRRIGLGSMAVAALLALCLPMGVWGAPGESGTIGQAVEEEIAEHYGQADAKVQDYIRWTAGQFAPDGLWVPEDLLQGLSEEERAARSAACVKTIKAAAEPLVETSDGDAVTSGRIMVDTQDGAEKVAKMLEAEPRLRLVSSERLSPEQMIRAVFLDRGDAFLITFEPVPPFAPEGSRALLDAFNEKHPRGVRTHHYRTVERDDGRLVGHIMGDGEQGKDALVAMLEASPKLRLLHAGPVTEGLLRKTPPYGEELSKEVYDVGFAPVAPFKPVDARRLLEAFNANHPRGVRTHHFRTSGGRGIGPSMGDLRKPEVHQALALVGVLGDEAPVDDVARIATCAPHRLMSNRARWLATAALGRIGDERVVPGLVSLLDHYNANTRMWARASLVRLTGRDLGADKEAWTTWWNNSGKAPRIEEAG